MLYGQLPSIMNWNEVELYKENALYEQTSYIGYWGVASAHPFAYRF